MYHMLAMLIGFDQRNRLRKFRGGTLSSTTGSNAFRRAWKQMLTEKKLTKMREAGHALGPGHSAGSPSACTETSLCHEIVSLSEV